MGAFGPPNLRAAASQPGSDPEQHTSVLAISHATACALGLKAAAVVLPFNTKGITQVALAQSQLYASHTDH